MLYVDEHNRTTQRTLADLVASTVADEKGSV